ncbi:MAG: BspA family leucine-rich repeat surface protein [Bacteroidetes bacterium]|nr:BspA family leucine-rich repeat surface protein [Bacteroidota bacterium]
MFLWAVSFNQPIDNRNVSSLLLGPLHALDHATAFNQPLNNWNTSNLKGLVRCFWTQLILINHPTIGILLMDQMGWMFQRAIIIQPNFEGLEFQVGVHNMSWQGYLICHSVDCYNYSSTITGWANNPATPSCRHLEAYTMHYDSISTPARDFLINTLGWSIIGDTIFAGQCGPVLH